MSSDSIHQPQAVGMKIPPGAERAYRQVWRCLRLSHLRLDKVCHARGGAPPARRVAGQRGQKLGLLERRIQLRNQCFHRHNAITRQRRFCFKRFQPLAPTASFPRIAQSIHRSVEGRV
jgi:hypothetical protein